MRIYIIANDGITLCPEIPPAMTEGEVVVASKENCTPPRLVANGFWHCGTLCPGSRSAERSVIGRGWLMSCGRRSRPCPSRNRNPMRSDRRSRASEVIAMLRRPEGATVDEVATAMGWQRHTVRGLFSGTLKKKLGLTLASAQEERGRVYRIPAPERT